MRVRILEPNINIWNSDEYGVFWTREMKYVVGKTGDVVDTVADMVQVQFQFVDEIVHDGLLTDIELDGEYTFWFHKYSVV